MSSLYEIIDEISAPKLLNVIIRTYLSVQYEGKFALHQCPNQFFNKFAIIKLNKDYLQIINQPKCICTLLLRIT